MKLTKIYIGSNNETGKLELDKILSVMITANQGYTIVQGVGYWNGKSEDTAIIEIYGDYNLGIIPELKRVCEQDSLLVAESIIDVKFYD